MKITRLYSGKDGQFDLYEDDGTTNGYSRGEWSRILVSYNEASGTLTIGARQGTFPGMIANRVFHVRWISGPAADAVKFDAKPGQSVSYSGQAVEVQRSAAPVHKVRAWHHAKKHGHKKHRHSRR